MKIVVRAEVEFVYDLNETENFGIESPEDAIEDVRNMIACGELNSTDFTYHWVTANDLSQPGGWYVEKDGLISDGPFDSDDEANEFADGEYPDEDTQIVYVN